MLIIAKAFRDLRMGELMDVYVDSNRETAKQWPGYPPMFSLSLAEQDHRQYLQEVFFRTPGAICGIWEEQGCYVSALRLEPYRDGLLLEALETAPDCRNQGYAKTLIRQVQQYLGSLGPVKLYSHIGKRNAASRKTHESCGFSRISDHAVYISGSVDYRCATYLYEVKTGTGGGESIEDCHVRT